MRIALIQVPFLLGFWMLLGPRALLWFGSVVAVTMFYNCFAKDRPLWDVLAQAGYLSVFVLTNWLNPGAPSPWPLWILGALFAMHSHLFGEIMDIVPDRAAQRRTTAVAIGARATKILVCLLLLVESLLATTLTAKPWLPWLLLAGVVVFAVDAWLWRERPYPTVLVKLFFMGWNAFLLCEIVESWLMLRPMR
jgi:4-hydroxybenzoate polyprenyltransferase